MTVLLLGDQLLADRGPLADHSDEPVLLVESRSFAARLPYHPHKLTLVVSAMRHRRDELREAGRTVHYHEVETFRDGFEAHAERRSGDSLVCMRPPTHGAADRLASLAGDAGLDLRFVPDARFICDAVTFDDWAADRETYRQGDFYRHLRRGTGYLMTGDEAGESDESEPVGGRWTFDEDNRRTPPADWEAPPVPAFEPDEITRAVQRDFTAELRGWAPGDAPSEIAGTDVDCSSPEPIDQEDARTTWAAPADFRWPVTRAQALEALSHFVEHRLPAFGPYQDAMLDDEWALAHSLLGAPLNLGLLHPEECIEAAVDAWERDAAPLQSVEGFVRQLLGWREFLRHVYRREMPALADANRLAADEPLPPAYWTGETHMACLRHAVQGVRERGYAHHIQRLMILSNLALLLGVRPRALNRWFHAGFVDAYHWVTTPNVVEMGLAAAGAFATKPYAASANYVHRMSDHCAGCAYDHDAATGEGACPLNALYWDFLDRHEGALRPGGRMALVYSHLDGVAAIRERATRLRAAARAGEL